jgi:hypothetical protein
MAIHTVNGTTIVTDYWPKPVPTSRWDWTAVREDYDAADDSIPPVGLGSTEKEAIEDLMGWMED